MFYVTIEAARNGGWTEPRKISRGTLGLIDAELRLRETVRRYGGRTDRRVSVMRADSRGRPWLVYASQQTGVSQ